jgi:hypothetical protein
MRTIKFLSVLALFGSIAWMVADPDYEPALSIVASLAAFIANFIIERRKVDTPAQQQTVIGNGIGVQAGGDVTIGDIHKAAGRKPNAK